MNIIKSVFSKTVFHTVFFVAVVALSLPVGSHAEEPVVTSPALSSEVKDSLQNKAQKKLYPGGRDEQDLKVQSAIQQPSRNMDGSSAAEASADPDHD